MLIYKYAYCIFIIIIIIIITICFSIISNHEIHCNIFLKWKVLTYTAKFLIFLDNILTIYFCTVVI